jgi:integrase
LAANGGLGNHDVATLPMNALDLKKGWLDYARPKTGVARAAPLWVETVEALKSWLAVRPEAKREEDAQLVFLTRQRRAWFRPGRFAEDENRAKGFDSPVSKSFKLLLDNVGLNGKRGFYCIRHGFETIAGDTGDQVAVNAIMGHADQSMAATYRERIDPERLQRVVEHVRQWLFAPTK